jgi:hypothetical protein
MVEDEETKIIPKSFVLVAAVWKLVIFCRLELVIVSLKNFICYHIRHVLWIPQVFFVCLYCHELVTRHRFGLVTACNSSWSQLTSLSQAFTGSYLLLTATGQVQSQSESSVMTVDQLASLSWCQTHMWGPRPDFCYCQTVAGLLMWGALWWEVGSFAIAADPCQHSHSRVWVPQDSWPYFTVWNSRLPELGGPGPCIYIPQKWGGLVIPPDTGFPFHRLLWLEGLGGGIQTRLHIQNWPTGQVVLMALAVLPRVRLLRKHHFHGFSIVVGHCLVMACLFIICWDITTHNFTR